MTPHTGFSHWRAGAKFLFSKPLPSNFRSFPPLWLFPSPTSSPWKGWTGVLDGEHCEQPTNVTRGLSRGKRNYNAIALGFTKVDADNMIVGNRGWLAQLVRAPALHAGGRRFESCTAHHFHPDRLLIGCTVTAIPAGPFCLTGCSGSGRQQKSLQPCSFTNRAARVGLTLYVGGVSLWLRRSGSWVGPGGCHRGTA